MRTALASLRPPAAVLIWLGGLLAAVFLASTIVDLMMDRREEGLLTLVAFSDLVLAFVFYRFGLLQFVFLTIVGDPFEGEFRALLLVGLTVAARRFVDLALLGKPIPGASSAPALWAVVFIATQILSLANAQDLPMALSGVRVYVQLLVILILLVDFVRSEREIRLLMGVFVAAGLMNLGVALYDSQFSDLDRVGGIIGNANRFGMMQMILLCLVSPLLFSVRSVWYRFALLVWVAAIAYSVTLAASRGVFLAAVAAVVVLVLFAQGISFRKRLAIGVAIPVLAGALLLLVPPQFLERIGTIPTTLDEAAQHSDRSIGTRLLYYQSGIQMGLDNPLTGVGIRHFDEELPAYAQKRDFKARGAHNMYISVFAESGFPGLIAFFGLLVSVILAARAGIPKSSTTTFAAMGIGVQLGLAAILVGGMFGTLQQSKVVWIVMGLAVVAQHARARRNA